MLKIYRYHYQMSIMTVLYQQKCIDVHYIAHSYTSVSDCLVGALLFPLLRDVLPERMLHLIFCISYDYMSEILKAYRLLQFVHYGHVHMPAKVYLAFLTRSIFWKNQFLICHIFPVRVSYSIFTVDVQ